jgi:exopolysaccharide production protein ExoQ
MTLLASPALPVPPLPARLRPLALQRGRGDVLDEGAAVLAMIFVPLDLPAVAGVRPLVTLLLLGLLVWRWRAVAPTIRAGAYAYLLAGLCMASALWAPDPGLALYRGVVWVLTISLGAMIAARLDHRQLVVALLVSQGVLAAASLAFPTTAWVGGPEGAYVELGIFPQKNVIGQRMMLLALACGAVMLSSGYAGRWRAAAFALMPVSLYLLFASGSLTAILLLCVGGAGLLFMALIWRPARRIRGAQPLLFFAGATAVPLVLLLLAGLFRVDLVADTLGAFGKDTTLTGRTWIWEVAARTLAENPVLGVGAEGFWRLDSFDAARVASLFGATADQFEFHNAYLEVAVHLGLVGLLAALYVWGRGLYEVALAWRLSPGRDPFLIALALCFVVRSLTESELFKLTLPGALLFWVLLFMAARELAERRARAAPAATGRGRARLARR